MIFKIKQQISIFLIKLYIKLIFHAILKKSIHVMNYESHNFER